MSVERAIDQALERWVRARSGSELLARAACAASRDEGLGHVCSALGDDGFSAADIAQLRTQSWVGEGGRFTPFVLDAQSNFYTWRNWRHEVQVARALLARALARALPPVEIDLAGDVAELFGGSDAAATRWQRTAVAAAPGSRIFVLTGGPGTGKTTTVLRMLLMLLRHAAACGLPDDPAIALAAPTGKAAQRLDEAIASGKQVLRTQLATESAFASLLDQVPHTQSQTLHRLLGFKPHDNTFAHGVDSPLAAAVVVVDEVSMIDIAMMRQLLDALRPDAMLILLGDPGQLYAIDAGSVLGDIVASIDENALSPAVAERLAPTVGTSMTESAAPLAGQVVTLTHVWRAGSELQAALNALRGGDAAWLDALLAGAGDDSLRLRVCADAAMLRERMETWIDAHPVLADLMNAGIAPAAALKRLRELQILCALRDSAFGASGINALMTRLLAQRFGFDAGDVWFHGRPVIVTRNDYTRDLYNGDVGIALQGEEAEGLRVWFDTGGSLRSFSPRTLPTHETAWAITIHRSQGSEYRDVAVVLPPDADSRILSRELLYTAVSRATRSAEIWTSAAALRAAAERQVRRRGGLRARLTVSTPAR
jgi:exodeoxyribonuclease V alpha subunit